MKYRKKINILFVSIIASCVLSSVSAQKKIINMPPDAIPAEGGIVKARDKITLLPGFNFNAPPNTSLRIDKDMICTAEYLTTAPAPSNRDIKDNPVVGAISGNFNVTPTGAATYTIPIEIPPGTNGMQPSVALTYNSQGGNGPLGMGWQLAGMSAITRTGSNIYYDGEVKGIKYYGRDNFTLNGMRLMHVSGYLSGDEEIIFKTETNDFSKIIGHKDTDYTRFHGFTVYTKDGKKLYFGKYDGTSDAFIDKPGNEGDIALAFMIKKIEDANGNYILFEYKQDGFGFRIKKIKYTGNNDGIAPYNEIQFFYEERKDIGDKYAKGSYVRDRLLLNKIKTYCENKLFREYQLKYIYDETNFDVYSRLVEVTKHNNTGEQVNSTIVEWGEN
ncbi:MAG: SpvB/TcaC N-terminal domain-containing protein, partial [Bacteroidota bacterium]